MSGMSQTKIYTSNKQDIKADTMTSVLATIDHEHHKVHSGSHFIFSDTFVLTSAASKEYIIQTGTNTSYSHFVFNVGCNVSTNFNFYETVTVGTVGAAINTFNNNRVLGTAPKTAIFSDPTNSTVGSSLVVFRTGSSAGVQGAASGQSNRAGEEFILKANTNYLVRITANEASCTGHIIGEWYEH